MKSPHHQPHYSPVSDCLLVLIHWITTPGTLTQPTEMPTRKTQSSSWTTTSSGSWRRRAASLQGLTAALPIRAPRMVSQDSKGWDSRVNTQPGMALKERRATRTITDTRITSTRQERESSKSSWRLRRPHVHTVGFRGAHRRVITAPSRAALQMVALGPTLWNTQATGVEQTLFSAIHRTELLSGFLLTVFYFYLWKQQRGYTV